MDQKSRTNKKVLLGMSGGVDSSVSAALLLEQGYEVIGAFMKNWSGDVNGPECKSSERIGEAFEECGWKQERRDAARVAAKLGIPFVTFDFEEEYRRDVVEYMFAEYERGRTPNPDVMCNKFIKFDRFVHMADELGCDLIATGHYARVLQTEETTAKAHLFVSRAPVDPIQRRIPTPHGDRQPVQRKSATFSEVSEDNGVKKYRLQKAVDDNKDQTYFLWAINPNVLSRVIFPIGHLTKPEVREKATELGLSVADKKDSTGICFVGDVQMSEFLRARLKPNPGNVITVDGTIVGHHDGIVFYTLGQRHGLGIGGGTPYYVIEKRAETNELVVSSNFHPSLFSKKLIAIQLNFFTDTKKNSAPLRCQARIRHRQPFQNCQVIFDETSAHVEFDQPQRAATPGQSIVFYDDECVIAGGIIDQILS